MRVLWVKTELLHPMDKGGRIRTYHMLSEISRHHEVTYLTLDDGTAAPDALERAREYAAHIVRIPFSPPAKGSAAFYRALAHNLVTPLPYAISRYRSALMEERIALHASNADLVICDFLAPAINLPAALPCPTILFQHNVEAMIWERHATVARNPITKAYMRQQWRRMERFEQAACRRCDQVIAVSSVDTAAMRSRYGITRVTDVPTGVDVQYFTPSGNVNRLPLNLVFTGSMDWMPNDDAMTWFLTEILPHIHGTRPDVSVTVVGRSPSARLRAIAAADARVEVTGRVDDVRPYLERGSIFIVPMRVGGGTRLKIFEAMAMGLPVVSTEIGAEGLPLQDGLTAVLRNDASGFAASVLALLDDAPTGRRVAAAGESMVRDRFSWAGVAGAFMAICEQVMQVRDGRAAQNSPSTLASC